MNLAGRTGWHGIESITGPRMFFLVCHAGETFYIDLEPNRTENRLAYTIDKDFDLWTQLEPLSLLDTSPHLPEVLQTFAFNIASKTHASGFIIEPVSGHRITGPLPRKKRKKAADDEEDGEEEVETVADLDEDCEDQQEIVVDTDVDTDIEGCSSEEGESEESDENKGKQKLTLPVEDTAPLIAKPRTSHDIKLG